ncbi:MAG: glycosyltransferase, partial [Aureibaculum sp.]
MPIKIFEYMAFGLPIIGSNFGHIKEYIEEDNCGIIINSLDSIEISNAMIELLTDRKKYDLYSNNGRKATLKKYRWDFEFDRLIGYYTKLLNERESNK